MQTDKVTKEKLDKYFDVTGRAIKKVKLVNDLELDSAELRKFAEDFLDMASRYYRDAQHFRDKGDIVNAFACLNYAHGWLDAGARLGLFDVGHDSVLFTVD
ncbi:hypothetical protein COV19_03090 [Candidatus Woesearchaeota archaeon CG10_big_fil_rev_8_21_14_0_10_44_13]|nr:MAG: hypothetical protein COV19_03090 [Candidatus Woesearchaeota archaeon CG10_big_fil_rev_8_21_14_0_10_44_13]